MWHGIWKDLGSPREGTVAEIRRSTRAQYHRDIRRLKADEERIRNQFLAEHIRSKNQKEFWRDVKKVKGHRKSIPNKIDDAKGDQNIADLFANKFYKLYNSVKYCESTMSDLQELILNDIQHKCDLHVDTVCTEHLHYITVNDVKCCVKLLKSDKKDGSLNLYTNHLINGTGRLFVMISLLFTAILIHGFCPLPMLYGTMTPLPKINGTTQSDNFRAITLCSTLSKLFDIIILEKCKELMKTSNLQFGFKEDSSTTACTFAVQEIISYYNDHRTNVFCSLLDCSKGFDRIEYCTLFKKLIKRNMCPVVIRILLFMYLNQSLTVKWNGCYSSRFKVSNGVKQGGVTSPLLFCIYIDDLLNNLSKNGIGCHMGTNFCGALCYADDIILLSPNVQGLKDMLKECEMYACCHNIKFNVQKSQIIVFPCKAQSNIHPSLTISNELIPVVTKVKHLGHILCNNGGYLDESYIAGCFNRTVNMLLANFGSISSDILKKLFTHYCTNFYGVALCNVRSKGFNNLHILWRKAVKRILRLPFRTHNVLLPCILGKPDFDTAILIRIVKFYISMLYSSNDIVKCLAHRCQQQTVSNMGKNISLCYHKYGMSEFSVDSLSQLLNITCTDNNIEYTAALCNELIILRDRQLDSILIYQEYNDILNYLCTM